jgi:lysozyme
MTEPSIQHTPNRIQALFWLLLLIFVPFLFVFRMKIQSLFYAKTQCEEPRRREWHSFDVPIPVGYAVHGIDVSHYSCLIDWEEVKRMSQNGRRVDFAYMRGTRGLDLVDYQFAKNWEAARDAKILRGAYHFYTFRDNPLDQARFFIEHVQIEKGDLPPVLDIEDDKDIDDRRLKKADILRGISAWLQYVEKQTGVRPMIYTNLDYFKRYIEGNFKPYPIWIASYKSIGNVHLPDNRQWFFWQFSDKARCNGISEPIDLNVFAGNIGQLQAICKK